MGWQLIKINMKPTGLQMPQSGHFSAGVIRVWVHVIPKHNSVLGSKNRRNIVVE